MALRRRPSGLRGPAPIFKKRFVSFSKTAANTTPTEIVKITVAESGTVYAVKVDLVGLGLSTTKEDVQEARLFIDCVDGDPQSVPDPLVTGDDPDFVELPQIDPINGFYAGSLFISGNAGGTDSQDITTPMHLREKFRFRRKCDRRAEIRLFTDTIVRAQAAQTVVISGGMQIVFRTR